MATEVLTPQRTLDTRIAFRTSWDNYQAITRAIGNQPILVAYDGETIELMSPDPEHDNFKEIASVVVRTIAGVLKVPCKGMGSARWERPAASRAVEADTSFYFTVDKIRVARQRPKDKKTWPIPDLAVEIDMSPSQVDRPGIYAALRVPEVWRFDGVSVRIDRLGDDGRYQSVPESGWLGVRPEEIYRLLALDAEDDNDLASKVRKWARKFLLPRWRGRA